MKRGAVSPRDMSFRHVHSAALRFSTWIDAKRDGRAHAQSLTDLRDAARLVRGLHVNLTDTFSNYLFELFIGLTRTRKDDLFRSAASMQGLAELAN